MAGFIRKPQVIRNTVFIIKYYGLPVWWRCLTASRGETFLGILSEMGRI